MSDEHSFGDVLVRISGVSLAFDGRQVLKPTDAEVLDIIRPGTCTGQVVGILGPSGVGKTQLSRILAGLQAPSSGTVEVMVGGRMVPVEPGIVGMVAQNYPLRPNRTVLGNLMIATERSGKSAQERREKAASYLDLFGLAGREKDYPENLSGGQRQRIAIAQSLLCSEHFIIMDEPFTGLDPLMKKKVCQTIEKVANLHEQNTIFVVAHDIAALVMIADCLWLLGRERGEDGSVIPGATIKHRFDLIERGLAWHPDISRTPAFHEFVNEVEDRYENL